MMSVALKEKTMPEDKREMPIRQMKGETPLRHLNGKMSKNKKSINTKAPEPIDMVEDAGVYLLMEEIDFYSIKPVIEFIVKENIKKKHDKLTLMIMTPGGNTWACFALVDAMRGSRIPIETVGVGVVASAGLDIFIAGHHRVLTPNTMILSHQFAAGAYGKAHELIASQKEFKQLDDIVMRHYKKFTKLKVKEIKTKLMPASDVWLTAKDAVKLTLADEIRDPD